MSQVAWTDWITAYVTSNLFQSTIVPSRALSCKAKERPHASKECGPGRLRLHLRVRLYQTPSPGRPHGSSDMPCRLHPVDVYVGNRGINPVSKDEFPSGNISHSS